MRSVPGEITSGFTFWRHDFTIHLFVRGSRWNSYDRNQKDALAISVTTQIVQQCTSNDRKRKEELRLSTCPYFAYLGHAKSLAPVQETGVACGIEFDFVVSGECHERQLRQKWTEKLAPCIPALALPIRIA